MLSGADRGQAKLVHVHFFAASATHGYTKFILWLLLLSSSSSCFGHDGDVQCLKNLLQSLGDPNGILQSSWNFSNVTEGSICQFTGVECWQPNENRVLSLHLGNLGLQGSFPRGLKLCSSMNTLDLSSNNFSGLLPEDISQLMPYLTTLDLSYNSFSGEIPRGIANLTYLNTLKLEHNQFTGRIPEQMGELARLVQFNVADNLLSGPIPSTLSRFPSSNFANNRGICGKPSSYDCEKQFRARIRVRLRRINDSSSIGAAVGFVVGFVVAFYFPHWFIFCGKLRPYAFRVCA